MGSEQTSTHPPRHGPPTPIAQMGAWDFWAHPDSVGLSAEDAAAIKSSTATPEQISRARSRGQAAMNALIVAEGPQCRRPS